MVRILLRNYSICDDSFFVSVHGPKQIADKLKLRAISAMIDDCITRDKEQDIAVWEVMDFAPTVPEDALLTHLFLQPQKGRSNIVEVLTDAELWQLGTKAQTKLLEVSR